MVNFFREMRRRNVFRVVAAYVVGAWFLVQTALTLENVMNLPEWFDAFVMSLAIMGLPISVVLAWAFELTPDGFKRTALVSPEASISETTGKRLDIAIIFGLLLVAGVMAAGIFNPGNKVRVASLSGNNSVAVLPFTNRSANQDDAYFADGIHDELLTQLSKIDTMEVISRTSVMGYRETSKRIPDIAKELGVAVILEGAVQRAGDRVRITVQLIDGKDDTHLWAENYDRALTTENIFDIQAEITDVIAEALETIISGEEKTILTSQPTQNVMAFEAYMQGRLLARPNGGNESDLIKAVASYGKAIDVDPNYAEAFAGKAYAQMALYWFHGRDSSYREAARANLDKAIALSPDTFETLFSDGFYYYWGYQDFRRADRLFDKALKVAPNSVDALAGKAFIARRLGRFVDSAVDLEKAHRLDPLSFYLIPELALTRVLIGDFDGANAMVERAKMMQPNSIRGAAFEASVLQFQGDELGAYDAILKTENYLPKQKVDYAIATRDPEKILTALAAWPEHMRSNVRNPAMYEITRIRGLLAMGEKEQADKEIDALRIRSADFPAAEWHSGLEYSPVTLPGLFGDLSVVEKLAKQYENLPIDDYMSALTDYADIADAFARAGSPERALDYLEKMRDITGPFMVLVMQDSEWADGLQDHPRFKKMIADYEIWAEGKNG